LLQPSSASPPDSDPLLGFETEQEVKTESPEPVVEARTSVDPPESLTLPTQLSERVDALERGLATANAEVALLRSDVATLVRAVDDIRTRSRRPAATNSAVQRPAPRTASLIAGVALVVVAAGWLWMSNRTGVEPVAPATPTSQLPVAVEPAPSKAPAADTAPAASSAVPNKTAADTATPPTVKPATSSAKPATPSPISSATPARASPVTYVGTLSIDAQPGGEVFIDRRTAGRTPLRVPNLKAGSHLVWIERDGYQRFTRVVQVPSDRTSRLWADLEPLTPR